MIKYYIASCVFTEQFPELSFKIQDYVEKNFGFSVVRCCVPEFKIKEFEERMPEGKIRESWRRLADSGRFKAGGIRTSMWMASTCAATGAESTKMWLFW